MIKNTKNNVVYFTFDSFSRLGLKHCFTSRTGGVSGGPQASLNLSFARDSAENVRKNYEIIAGAVGFSAENTVFTAQTHTTNVRRVGVGDRGKGFSRQSDFQDIDGLITDEPSVVLTAFSADCALLFFYDPKNRAIALAHSGWRGTANGMARAAAESLSEAFGSRPEDLVCGIGPCIHECCFEVGLDVAEEFAEKLPFSRNYISKSDTAGKFFVDLEGINAQALINAGVLPENIEPAGLCACCRPDLFYSHRRSGLDRGSMAAFLWL